MRDQELLHDYVSGAPRAFAELVQRHAGWVHAVARRRLRDAHLAEDVTQSVFLVLARKAPALRGRRGIVLSAWLFEVTRMTILRLQRDQIRRQRREMHAATMRETSTESANEAWRELERMLDESVARLRDRDRRAV